MSTEITRAYRPNNDGTIVMIDVLTIDGKPCDRYGNPYTPTGETRELLGWPDASVGVYKTDGGVEILVPEL